MKPLVTSPQPQLIKKPHVFLENVRIFHDERPQFLWWPFIFFVWRVKKNKLSVTLAGIFWLIYSLNVSRIYLIYRTDTKNIFCYSLSDEFNYFYHLSLSLWVVLLPTCLLTVSVYVCILSVHTWDSDSQLSQQVGSRSQPMVCLMVSHILRHCVGAAVRYWMRVFSK